MAVGNSIDDEIKEQHTKVIKEKDFKNKLSYFLYYYKYHTIIAIIVSAAVIATIVGFVTKKDPVLQVVFVNGFPTQDSETFMADFGKAIGIDEEKEEVLLDDTFYVSVENPTTFDEENQEKLFIMASAGQVDVCVVDEPFFKKLVQQGYMLDLSTVLSEEQMERYADDLFYYDSSENMHEGEEAVGLKVSDAEKIVSTKSFPNADCYFCIIVNSDQIDNSLAFLEYLEGNLDDPDM